MPDPVQPTPIGQSDWLSQLKQSYSQIQFGPGVVGKTSRATIGVIAVWGVVIWRIGPDWVSNAFLFGAGVAATAIYCWWVHKTHAFAEKNPQVALLEGAQLIEYQRFQAEVNGKLVPQTLPIPRPTDPIKIDVEQ